MLVNDARFGSDAEAISYAMERTIDAYEAHGEICRISSIAEGTHKDGSSHYDDRAFDTLLYDVPEEKRLAILRDIRESLDCGMLLYGEFEGTPNSDFLIIYGDENHMNHMHLQWKKWRAMNR